jgi:hypothetical protein
LSSRSQTRISVSRILWRCTIMSTVP